MRQHRGESAPCRQGGRRLWAACLLLLPTVPLSALSLLAQAPSSERVYFSRHRDFRIPFNVEPGEVRLATVKLHVSEDFGQTWQLRASSSPTAAERFFPFRTERDGWYWFTVQTVDVQNRAYPAVVDAQTSPGLRVCVDTRDPLVTLQQSTSTDGGVAVSWSVQDENLGHLKQNRADSLILEYRAQGRGGLWTRVPGEQRVAGQRSWNPEGGLPIEVRLRVFDDAGNEGQQTITVTSGNAGAGGGGARTVTPGYAGETAPRSAPPDMRLVNTKQINLRYDVQETGKSGIAEVQLWYTDGRTWEMKGNKKDPKAPYLYDVELASEGRHGFTLIARSGVGLSEREPQVGDPPQVWVEADWTRPTVVLQGVEVGRGQDTGILFLTYTAEDKNLDPRGSITFSYATDLNGEWTKFQEKQDNAGRLRWTMPASVPYQFYVRVSATDRAGNVGHDQTKEVVKVDLARPKARVLGIEPVNNP